MQTEEKLDVSSKGEQTQFEEREATSDLMPGEELIDEKKLLRKMDWWLIPWLSVLYLLSFLDRTAIGNAQVFGLSKDLGLSSQQYNLCLTIFFIPYALAEPITNVLLKRLSPRLFLSSIMILWGACMLAQGFCTGFKSLMATRFLLGLTEAGLFPGVNMYLSCWYKRTEFGVRGSVFFSAATAAGAFGGLLAALISKMNGVGGRRGWEWIFIWYGLITMVAGLASYWIIQDFPDTAKFLTEPERAFVIRRLKNDSQASAGGESFSWSAIRAALTDWKMWLSMLIYAGSDAPLYAFSLFVPSIIKELGYSAIRANLISVPIYVFACICTVSLGFYASRTQRRGIYNLIFMGIGCVGYILLIAVPSSLPGLKYFAIFLAASGIYPLIPNTITWASNSFEGAYKRSFAIGMVIGFGNLNGAVSSNIYRAQDAPRYVLGHSVVLGYIALGFVCSALNMWLLSRENARRDRGERDELIEPNGSETGDMPFKNADGVTTFTSHEQARIVLGDKHSSFRYLI